MYEGYGRDAEDCRTGEMRDKSTKSLESEVNYNHCTEQME
jgi:hypothetical protein